MIHPWNRMRWEQLPAFPRLPAVMLLCGPEGVGKRDFARALSSALLCQQPAAAREACGRCQACRLLESGSHPDLRLVELSAAEDEADGATPSDESAASAGSATARFIKVGAIRALADFLALRAHFGGRKVVLVHPADRLHPAAANALLKTLEEPPSATHFLLMTGQPARLPATVRSRCVRIAFTLPPAQAAAAWLREQGAAQADLALAQAGGAPLAALALDREAYWTARKTLIDEALVQERPDPVAVVDRLGTDQLPLVVGTLQRWCHDLVAVKAGGSVRYNPDCAQILHRIASRVPCVPLLALSRELQGVVRWLEHPLNARLVAERCLLGYRNAITTTES